MQMERVKGIVKAEEGRGGEKEGREKGCDLHRKLLRLKLLSVERERENSNRIHFRKVIYFPTIKDLEVRLWISLWGCESFYTFTRPRAGSHTRWLSKSK